METLAVLIALNILALLCFWPRLWFGARATGTHRLRLALALAIGLSLASALAAMLAGLITAMGPALWLCIVSTLLLYALMVARQPAAWALSPILVAYFSVLALIAAALTVAAAFQPEPIYQLSGPLDGFLIAHILASLATYGLVTLAAAAAAAIWLQERALKRRWPGRAAEHLPPIAVAESWLQTLLGWALAVLAVGAATGMALEWLKSGQLIVLDHKTVLSWAALAAILLVLALHRLSGLRGRRVARLVLLAHLLLTLAYPGVKFANQVLLGV